MVSGSRVLSLVFLIPSLSVPVIPVRGKLIRFKSSSSPTHERKKSSSSPTTTSSLSRMATEASSTSSSVAAGDGFSPSANGDSAPSSASSASSAIDFLSLCHRLKTTKRAGWVRKEIKDPESIADHMYRMGLMALIASDIPGVDRDKLGFRYFNLSCHWDTMTAFCFYFFPDSASNLISRCIKMAIVHDIAEAVVGDITPSDGVSKAEKSRREQEALDHMCKLLGGGSRAQEIGELWLEYEENSSPEAKIVKDLDKVEMILQASEYENGKGFLG
ncbi:HD domain-containing protein 2 [Morella rubra]|uniref:5'-deoxynucleotidase n=1 Tax=Morella rubra TaxID=262757 RepID=A0A6A1UWP2_9ROSI|nr:HD domain-containing protein 2 [Morella rubra]